ncbi:MAG: hypothetical protein ABIK28_22795 [Planctomycetota bacterium]
MKLTMLLGFALIVCLATGCSFSTTAKNFNGLKDMNGKEAAHISTTNYAMNFLFLWPVFGDASLENTVSDFTKAAKEEGAEEVRIVQSDSMTYWFIFPPLSFFIHPVVTNVAGDASMK